MDSFPLQRKFGTLAHGNDFVKLPSASMLCCADVLNFARPPTCHKSDCSNKLHYCMNITTATSDAWIRKEIETSEQRCSTPTPTNSDAPNGAEPNSENGIEKGPNKHSLRKEKKSQSRRRETHHHPRKLPEKPRSGWTL